MKKKNYHLTKNCNDTYDCDYTGSAESLISDLNGKFTAVFLDNKLLEAISKVTNGKSYPKFHLVLDCNHLDENLIYVSIEWTDNLTAVNPFCNEELTNDINRVVNDYIVNVLGYPLNEPCATSFIDKLTSNYPAFKKYFIKE